MVLKEVNFEEEKKLTSKQFDFDLEKSYIENSKIEENI